MPPSDDGAAGTSPTSPPERSDFPDSGVNSLASPAQRGVATLVDLVVAAGPTAAVVAALAAAGTVTEADARAVAWVTMAFVATWVAYQVVAVAAWGRTLGSWAMGYRVARWSDGRNPAVAQASLRALLPAAFMAIPLPVVNMGWVVVFLSATSNPLHRGYHDLAGGTVVVRTR